MTTFGAVAFLLLTGLAFAVFESRREKPAPVRPPALSFVAGVIEPGLPVFNILQRAGEPTCRNPGADGERWLYSRAMEIPQDCEPSRGDLVIVVRGDRVERFMPEYELYGEVSSPADLEAFRRRYAPRR